MKRYEAYKNSGLEWMGEIPENWGKTKIKHLFTVVAGATPESTNESFWDGDIAWITPADFKTNDHFVEKGRKTITVEGYNSCATTLVPQGSIIFSKRAPIGSVVIAKAPLCTNQGCLSCVPNPGVSSDFYYYAMSVFTDAFEMKGSGTTFKEISAFDFSDFPMPCPSLKEQETIAAYLDHKVGQIDKSISEIDSQIDSLKAYRQSIISEAVTKGLDKNVKMKDSSIEWIGEIPEGWNVIPMKHYFYMKGRIGWQGLKADEFMEEGPYIVTGTDFKNGRVNWNTCYHITEERYQEAPEIHVHKGDVLITKDGTIGKLAYIDEKPEKVSLNSHLLILRPTKDVIDNYFVFWSLQSSAFKDYSGLASSGSTMASLSQEKIGAYLMALPPVDEQYVIAKYLENKTAQIDVAINALDAQKIDLKALKQAVISEAVTGKIDVRDWTPSAE